MRRRRGEERRQRRQQAKISETKTWKTDNSEYKWQYDITFPCGQYLSRSPPSLGGDRFSMKTGLGQREGNGFRTRVVRFLLKPTK